MQSGDDIEALLARIAIGHRPSFDMLYDRTSPKLFGICLRILKQRAEAEEALQEVYVKIWKNADRYRSDIARPMTWLITIARNHAIDRLRARKVKTVDIEAAGQLADSAVGPEAAAVRSSEFAQIERCLEELDPARAAAVKGAYLDGDSYVELAARHSVPVNTMRTWLRRSLISLRECLSR